MEEKGEKPMKIKSFLNPFFATATSLLIGITTLSAGGPEDEDIAIIGSGSSAFASAIHLAQKGARVTMIEEGIVGGTCVNVGCVPSKIFIRSGNIKHLQTSHPFEGIERKSPKSNPTLLRDQQQKRVLELRKSKYQDVLSQNPNIKFIQGTARFLGPDKISVETSEEDPLELNPTKILIATGSTPTIPDIMGLKDTPYWTSTEALQSGILPKHLIVLGGSVVALELAQAFSHHGSKVTMLARSTLLSKEDPDIGKELKNLFEGEGIRVLLHTLPKSVAFKEGFFQIDTGEETLLGDHLLVAAGRHANIGRLGLEKTGIKIDSQGRIFVDNHLRTNVKNIFAAGDCTNLPQYVYVAAASGTNAAINMLGGNASLDLSVVPEVTFTEPQVATVGLTAKKATELGYVVDTRTLTLDNVSRALANFDTRGFIKLVADRKTGHILGSQMVAPEAGDVIQTVAMAIRSKMTTKDLASQLFPYLTMVEGVKLCAQTFFTDVKKLSCCASTVVEEDVVEEQLINESVLLSENGIERTSCCSHEDKKEDNKE